MQNSKVTAERMTLAVVTTGLVVTAFDRLGSRSNQERGSTALKATDFIAEIVLIAVFVGLVVRALKRPAREAPSPRGWMWVPVWVIGALASVALLTLRIEQSMLQTLGHSRRALARAQSADRLTGRISHLMEAVTAEGNNVARTHAHHVFTGTSPEETLSRENVRTHREALRRLADVIEELINECNLAQSRKLPPEALGADVSLVRNCFVVLQRGTRATLEKSTLIDQHWDEWQSRGVRAENDIYTPWQKELLRLQDEMKSSQKDLAAAKEKLRQGGVRE